MGIERPLNKNPWENQDKETAAKLNRHSYSSLMGDYGGGSAGVWSYIIHGQRREPDVIYHNSEGAATGSGMGQGHGYGRPKPE